MAKLFGTDGVRGIANVAPMTAEMALAIGRAVAHISKQHNHRRRIVIGKDTRLSGYMIETALTAGICSMGVDVLLVGPMPTPGIAFITRSMRADAGMVISASHNPYQDNGIKIFSRDGFKIHDEIEAEIERLVTTHKIKGIRPAASEIGKAARIEDAIGRYIIFCKNTFPDDSTLEGLKIVLDCANGATYKVAPIIFSELGAEITPIHDQPNGMNINDNCGALYPTDLIGKVLETKADLGLAFDGDGDRLIAVDEQGNLLTGDHIIAICAKAMQARGQLLNNLVVATAMSNYGFHETMRKLGIQVCEAEVGDRYVLQMMHAQGAVLGGEDSGHIIFRNLHTTGDGIISALQLLAILQGSGQKLSELASIIRRAPQVLINVAVAAKPSLTELAPLQEAIRKAEAELAECGRVLVRYSGTQAICRVMVESPTAELTQRLAAELAAIVKQQLA